MSTKGSTGFGKFIKILWIFFISGFVVIGLYIFLVSINFLNLFGEMPSLEILENPRSEVASELYTHDNALIGKYFRENRTPVEYEELSPNLINALKATEDSRFESHSGIDFTSLLRVFFKTIILRQSNAGGGSTISQQLAKNLFETRSTLYQGKLSEVPGLRTLIVKTKEWLTSVKIERAYTKREILTMYLNTVDFGSNAFGIKVAARTFFSTSPDSLSVPQAAMLVGLLKAPTFYSPIYNPDNALKRRNTVFAQMEKYNYLTPTERASLSKLPLKVNYNIENHNSGIATYFRSVITHYLITWCKERNLDVYSDGLKIYTTLDSRIQKYAEDAVTQHMKDIQKKFFDFYKGKKPWLDEKGKEIPGFVEYAAKRSDRYRYLKAQFGDDSAAIWKIMKTPIRMRVFSWNGERDTTLSPLDSIKYYKHFLPIQVISRPGLEE